MLTFIKKLLGRENLSCKTCTSTKDLVVFLRTHEAACEECVATHLGKAIKDKLEVKLREQEVPNTDETPGGPWCMDCVPHPCTCLPKKNVSIEELHARLVVKAKEIANLSRNNRKLTTDNRALTEKLEGLYQDLTDAQIIFSKHWMVSSKSSAVDLVRRAVEGYDNLLNSLKHYKAELEREQVKNQNVEYAFNLSQDTAERRKRRLDEMAQENYDLRKQLKQKEAELLLQKDRMDKYTRRATCPYHSFATDDFKQCNCKRRTW